MRPSPRIKLKISTKSGTCLAVIPTDKLYTVLHDDEPITLRLTSSVNMDQHKYPAAAWTSMTRANTRAKQLNALFATDKFTIAIVRPVVADTVQ